jgi:predicted DNA-binding protein (MmcQ/YjbR family)
MTLEDIQQICRQFDNVTEDIKWGHHLCFSIGTMFLITTPDEFPVGATFKVSNEDFEELITKEGITPARYLARYKWVDVDNINRFSQKEWEYYLRNAYDIVAAKEKNKKKKKSTSKQTSSKKSAAKPKTTVSKKSPTKKSSSKAVNKKSPRKKSV